MKLSNKDMSIFQCIPYVTDCVLAELEKLGAKYVESRSVEFSKSFEESGPSTPIFFILSPGVNPLKVSLFLL